MWERGHGMSGGERAVRGANNPCEVQTIKTGHSQQASACAQRPNRLPGLGRPNAPCPAPPLHGSALHPHQFTSSSLKRPPYPDLVLALQTGRTQSTQRDLAQKHDACGAARAAYTALPQALGARTSLENPAAAAAPPRQTASGLRGMAGRGARDQRGSSRNRGVQEYAQRPSLAACSKGALRGPPENV